MGWTLIRVRRAQSVLQLSLLHHQGVRLKNIECPIIVNAAKLQCTFHHVLVAWWLFIGCKYRVKSEI